MQLVYIRGPSRGRETGEILAHADILFLRSALKMLRGGVEKHTPLCYVASAQCMVQNLNRVYIQAVRSYETVELVFGNFSIHMLISHF